MTHTPVSRRHARRRASATSSGETVDPIVPPQPFPVPNGAHEHAPDREQAPLPGLVQRLTEPDVAEAPVVRRWVDGVTPTNLTPPPVTTTVTPPTTAPQPGPWQRTAPTQNGARNGGVSTTRQRAITPVPQPMQGPQASPDLDRLFEWCSGQDTDASTIKGGVAALLATGGSLDGLREFNNVQVSLLHVAAERRPEADLITYLVDRGARLDARDSRGRTPLHAAAKGAKTTNAQALLAAGADLGATDLAGWTAYDVAVAGGFKACAVALAAQARTLDPTGPDPEALPLAPGPHSTPAILAAATKSMDPGMGPDRILAMYQDLYRYEDLRPILDIAALEAVSSRATDPNALRIFLSDTETTLVMRNAFPYGSYNDLDIRSGGGITQKLEGTVTVGGNRKATESNGQEVADSARTVLGTLIHELTHHAARKIFDNNAIPVDRGDQAQLELYLAAYREDSVRWLDETLTPGTAAARRVGFEDIEHGYDKFHLQLQEIIVRAPQTLVQFGEVAEDALPSQIKYFRQQFLPRARTFVQGHGQSGQVTTPGGPGLTDFGTVPGTGRETVPLASLTAERLATMVVSQLTHGRHHSQEGGATKVDDLLTEHTDVELAGFATTDRDTLRDAREERGALPKKVTAEKVRKAITKALPKKYAARDLAVSEVDQLVADLAGVVRTGKKVDDGLTRVLKPVFHT